MSYRTEIVEYPFLPGQFCVSLEGLNQSECCNSIDGVSKTNNLFDLSLSQFCDYLVHCRSVSRHLQKRLQVGRCGLLTLGIPSINLFPLHGAGKDWKPVFSVHKHFNSTSPGYLATHSGPRMDNQQLDTIQNGISSVTGLQKPLNTQFHGESDDNNLFARLTRGEEEQWRIWEDNHHLAFLTPFPNSPGYTVVIPRRHLSSDIFSLEEKNEFIPLVKAAYTVANYIRRSL